MCTAFVVSLGHLYLYPDLFGVELCPSEDVPADERMIFHHGWSAMLVIALIEVISFCLKAWSTAHHPVLANAMAQKLEGNLGVLFGEYLVVGTGYLLMGTNIMPVFLDPRTGRRVYGVRYMVWFVDACGLIYLDCRCLFSQEFKSFWRSYIFMWGNVASGLLAALAVKWSVHWLLLLISVLCVAVVVYMLVDIAWRDPRPRSGFGKAPVKLGILLFLVACWGLYGLIFEAGFQELISPWTEQLLFTGLDLSMKITHTVVLMAFRATQYDIDAEVGRMRSEQRRFVTELALERATTERDLAQLRERQMAANSVSLTALALHQHGADTHHTLSTVQEQQWVPGYGGEIARSEAETEGSFGERSGSMGMRRRGAWRPSYLKGAEGELQHNWTSTPGLQLGLPTVMQLQSRMGQGVMTEATRRGVMGAEEFEELRRLEDLGGLHDAMENKYNVQLREQTYLISGLNHIMYNPQHWTATLVQLRGRACLPAPGRLLLLEALCLQLLAEFAPEVAKQIEMTGTMHALLGSAVLFLVVFRTQYAFRKWWDGRTAFGRMTQISRTLAQELCNYVNDDAACEQCVRYIIVAVVATRCHLRNTPLEPVCLPLSLNRPKEKLFLRDGISVADPELLAGIIEDHEIEEVAQQRHMPFFATMKIRQGLRKAMLANKVMPFHMAIEKSICSMDVEIGQTERLLTPMPFIYVAHLRSLLFLFLFGLPFVFLVSLGRLMMLCVGVACYLLMGLEDTAVELENPFGNSANHLPLDLYCIDISRALLEMLAARETMPLPDVNVKLHKKHKLRKKKKEEEEEEEEEVAEEGDDDDDDDDG
eukprot:gene5605-6791_t